MFFNKYCEMTSKKRRTNEEIETQIFGATLKVVEKCGFAKTTMKAIALEARMQERVLYKRFPEGLGDLLSQFANQQYRFWLHQPIIKANRHGEHDEYRSNKHFFTEIIKTLYADKGLRQLLIWQLSEENPAISETLAASEAMYSATVSTFSQSIKQKNPHLGTTLAIILGGIQYIALLKEKTPYWETDFNTDKGKQHLIEVVNEMIDTAFTGAMPSDDAIQIATNMKNKGIDNKTIAECTGLSIAQILNLPSF